MSSVPYRSRSRSPPYRSHSPAKKLGPPPLLDLDRDRKFPGRYRDPIPYDLKACYGREVDMSDPYERERYKQWEREYREWYEKYGKSYHGVSSDQPRGRAPLLSRDPYTPERVPLMRQRDGSPYARGRRDDYSPPTQSHSGSAAGGPRSRNTSGLTYQERCAKEYGLLPLPNTAPNRGGMGKEPLKGLKDREPPLSSAAIDPKGLKHKKHRKKRKGDDSDVFSHSDSMDDTRKDERKGDGPLMASSRDDATPVRDEPMDGAAVPYKSASDKERKEKSKGKVEKVKRKSENSASKKETSGKVVKSSRDMDMERDSKAPLAEPPFKRTKEDLPHKAEAIKPSTSVKEEKGPLIRKVPRPTKHHQDTKPVKDEPKPKKELVKDPAVKPEKGLTKEIKSKRDVEKAIKTEEKPSVKAGEIKQEKRRRKEDLSAGKELDLASVKSPRVDVPDMAKGSPKPKAKVDAEKPTEKVKPAIPPLMDIKPGPLRKIKINREIGKRISTDTAPSPESSDAAPKSRPDKARGKMRRRVQAADGSVLVDYTR